MPSRRILIGTKPMLSFLNPVTSLSPETVGLIVAAVIVVGGLLIYGGRDLIRLSFTRIWAISGVVFRESFRRRVLWIAPLAMLGVVVISQFQQPVDEQDAIRQTIKFCIFASGLLVVVTGILLSCTNLPRDIESKVIFTIVTKPATRLDLALGKILGFSRVTATILLIMGLFTLAFVHIQSASLQRSIDARLASGTLDEFSRNLLTQYREQGLLRARELSAAPRMLTVVKYTPASDGFVVAGTGQIIKVPFAPTEDQFVPLGVANAPPGGAGAIFMLSLGYELSDVIRNDAPEALPTPFIQPPADEGPGDVKVSVSFALPDGSEVVSAQQLNGNKPWVLKDPSGKAPLQVMIPPPLAEQLARTKRFYATDNLQTSNYRLRVGSDPGWFVVPGAQNQATTIRPVPDFVNPPQTYLVTGRDGRFGQLIPAADASNGTKTPTRAIYRYDGSPVLGDAAGKVTLQLRVGVEQANDEDASTPAILVEAIDQKSDARVSTTVAIENRRPFFVELPAQPFASGRFDLVVSAVNNGMVIGLTEKSVGVITAHHSLAANLFKGLLSQWLLSVLVVTIGFFWSTFVSWPIAIVASLLLFLGRWLVDQVRDSLQPGMGASIATDLQANATGARVISNTFDFFAQTLTRLANFLPDLGQFSTGDLLERGVMVPWSIPGAGGIVLLLFGLPLLSLSYIWLRNKEVAP